MAKFFINRPIVAIVIAILMVLVGVVSMLSLPTSQFPNIADPMIQVRATYPGADAQTIAESVATPIEQQMSGVTGMARNSVCHLQVPRMSPRPMASSA